MFVVKVSGASGRPVVTHEGWVEIRGDDARVVVRTWTEDETERLEIVSEPWSDDGDYDSSQSVTIYCGPATGDGTSQACKTGWPE